ncbi:MAG: RdgB/HAM1 family non-canonical purine NTP pyrophosphatase [Actinomycetaceae bacterium]|nr:RdgB/HAM1 family non-canonical purine NTP pyrophosphatase [Arcanobacterium sp.]MDD7504716.1 RdgB/HAM1 family non-canonical purine NTP pyrophosphatase [Actinomycetaceae bacterium]MDY6143109.1 RdgB/HAM1 family non-canonical purine NTP pyrophosphatase [Arcanobacterium sp.]
MKQIVLASRNEHKVGELRAILGEQIAGFEPSMLIAAGEFSFPEPVEDAVTFEGNALIKARQIVQETGYAAIADDSGLCVDVLGGSPGVFSARWSGTHGNDAANLDLLLGQLADVPATHRGAHFACAAALVTPGGFEHTERGTIEGMLRYERSGDGGFGYDPIFQPTGMEHTLAEIPATEKNHISHRYRAFAALAPYIARALEL